MTLDAESAPASSRGRLTEGVVLGGVLVAATIVALGCGSDRPRWREAVLFAAAVAGGGSLAGWFVSRRTAASPAAAVGGALATTVVRILPPLAGLAWLATGGRDLRGAGADGLLVAFYLVMLATAVFLDIIAGRRGPPARCSSGVAGRKSQRRV